MKLVKEGWNSTIYRNGDFCIKRPREVVDSEVVKYLCDKKIPNVLTPIKLRGVDEYYV